MTRPTDEGIFRAMVDENGPPKLGAAATRLGVRQAKDIDVDQSGQVHRPAFRSGEKNGLSCAATVESLPPFALPVESGGSNGKTTVWQLDEADLPHELVAGRTRSRPK